MKGQPNVYIDDSIKGLEKKALEKVVASDWRDDILVPMPKIYVPDKDLIGKQVVINMCEFHEDCEPAEGYTRREVSLTGKCNCNLKGKTVTINGMKQTSRASLYRSTCYTIAESPNLIHESEFSPESLDKRHVTIGYIIEGEKNCFLTAGFNYVNKEEVLEGYIHNTGIVKLLLKGEIQLTRIPERAYPVECNWEGKNKRITGETLSWEQLREKILVK